MLTDEQRRLALYIAAGLRDGDMVEYEHLSLGSIKLRVSRMLKQVGAQNRPHFISIALTKGLISLDDLRKVV